MSAHSIEIMRHYQYSIRAECRCGWKTVRFFWNEDSKAKAHELFDKDVAQHEGQYNAAR